MTFMLNTLIFVARMLINKVPRTVTGDMMSMMGMMPERNRCALHVLLSCFPCWVQCIAHSDITSIRQYLRRVRIAEELRR